MNENSGIGFFGLLTILFICLKLTGYIDWAWIWVLSPIWIPIVVIIGLLLIIIGILLFFGLMFLILWIICVIFLDR